MTPNDWKSFDCDRYVAEKNLQDEIYASVAKRLFEVCTAPIRTDHVEPDKIVCERSPVSVQLDNTYVKDADRIKDQRIARLKSLCALHENEIAVLHRALRMAKAKIPPSASPARTAGDALASAMRGGRLLDGYAR